MPLLSERRRYEVSCPIACALDTLGERWTLLVVRELLPGPLRFSELKAAIAGINATILSRRLDQMRESGLVRMVEVKGQATGYAATERAETLWPILLALASWGADVAPSESLGLTPAAAVTAFIALRDSAAPRLAMGFTLGDQRLLWHPAAGFPLRRSEDPAEVEIVTTAQILFDLVTGRLSPQQVGQALAVTGAVSAFLDHLPGSA